eukprot:6632436-Prymnesium_polylepis.1
MSTRTRTHIGGAQGIRRDVLSGSRAVPFDAARCEFMHPLFAAQMPRPPSRPSRKPAAAGCSASDASAERLIQQAE